MTKPRRVIKKILARSAHHLLRYFLDAHLRRFLYTCLNDIESLSTMKRPRVGERRIDNNRAGGGAGGVTNACFVRAEYTVADSRIMRYNHPAWLRIIWSLPTLAREHQGPRESTFWIPGNHYSLLLILFPFNQCLPRDPLMPAVEEIANIYIRAFRWLTLGCCAVGTECGCVMNRGPTTGMQSRDNRLYWFRSEVTIVAVMTLSSKYWAFFSSLGIYVARTRFCAISIIEIFEQLIVWVGDGDEWRIYSEVDEFHSASDWWIGWN